MKDVNSLIQNIMLNMTISYSIQNLKNGYSIGIIPA